MIPANLEYASSPLMKHKGKRAAALATLALMAFGCMQPEGPDTSTVKGGEPVFEDDARRAGTSSSTNWPAELGSEWVEVLWHCDSTLWLEFKVLEGSSLSRRQTGRVSLYAATSIPALDSLHGFELRFKDTSTVVIPLGLIDSLKKEGRDTVRFNILLQTDHGEQCLLYDFSYQVRSRIYLGTGFSETSERTHALKKPEYFFRGGFEKTPMLPAPSGKGNSEICFYIPGTPYFWQASTSSDLVLMGPIPDGLFPLRLLRATPLGEGKAGTEVEVFEVLSQPDSGAVKTFRYDFHYGELVRRWVSSSIVTLRTGPTQ